VSSSSASSHGVAYGNPFCAAVKQSLAALNALVRLSAIRLPRLAPEDDQVLRRERAGLEKVFLLDQAKVREQAQDRACSRVVGRRARRAVDGVELAGDQHV